MSDAPRPIAPHEPLPATGADALAARTDPGREVRLRCDAVVIGSGAGGAVMAYELARAGKSVIVLEAGRHVPSTQFTELTTDMFDKVFQDRASQMNADGDILILQGRCVGGSTVVNGAVCFRIPDHVLEVWHRVHGLTNLEHGAFHALYAEVERRLSVHENLPHEISANARALMDGAAKLGWSHKPLSRNVKDCALTGFCFHGCASDRKQSMLVTYLPWAVAHGAELFADTHVSRVVLRGGRAVGVEAFVVSPTTGERICRLSVEAERVICAAGAIQTPILMSESGVLAPHGVLGQNLALHPSALVMAEMDRDVFGYRGATVGSYVDEFERPEKGGFLLEGGMAAPDILSVMLPGVGAPYLDALSAYPRFVATAALIHDENVGRVAWDGRRKVIHYRLTPPDRDKLRAAMKAAARAFFAAGARRVFLPTYGPGEVPTADAIDTTIDALTLEPSTLRMISYHPQGTCRMGADPRAALVDPRGRVHGVEGLYIADASLFPTSILVNPQMTVYALSTYIARQMIAA